MTTTYITNYIKSCARCGSAFRQRRGQNAKFCTSQCMRWADRERERDRHEAAKSRRMAELASTPLHVMYPGMVDVMERVAGMRPSWAEWQRSVDRRAAVWGGIMNCPRCNRTIVGAEGWCVVHGSATDYGYRPMVETHRDSWPVDGRPGHPRGVARNQRLFEREIPLPGFEG